MSKENVKEEQFARDTLERYSGCSIDMFQKSLLLTNFPKYVECFAKKRNLKIYEGAMFKVAHSEEEGISMLDFKIGSTAAALVVDLCSFLPIKSSLLLGMCGGLRRRYRVGEYIVPVASIRGEGTSDFYFTQEVPALGNFLMQRAVSEVLEEKKIPHHVGITFTSNLRFWEFNEEFIERLKATRAQAIELECATLFMASYKRKFTLGALLLISDLPLERSEIKTKKSAAYVYSTYMEDHIEMGCEMINKSLEMQSKLVKGAYHRNLQK